MERKGKFNLQADILMVNITGQEKDKIIKFSQKKLEHFKKPIFFL